VEDFDDKVVSAVGEAFNNIAIHAYSGSMSANAELEFAIAHDSLTIRLFDTGHGFDPSSEFEPDLDTLPESHMGLMIMRACMDEVAYLRGVAPAPNVLTLTKRYFATSAKAGSGSPPG
jgi:serine/threonine-protein kinase RsbW